MEPAKGCSICIGSLPGSVKTPWFGLMEGSEIPEEKTAEPSTVRDPTSKFNQPQTQEYPVEMYPGVICSAVHAATRCAFAITTLHPGSNLKNLVYEEGKNEARYNYKLELVPCRFCPRFLVPCSRNAIDTVDLQLLLRIVVLLGGQTVRRISEVQRAIRFVHQIIGAIELLSLVGVGQNRDLRFRVEGLQAPYIASGVSRHTHSTIRIQDHSI